MPGWAARWTRIFLPRWVIAGSYYFLHLLLVPPESKLSEGRGFMAPTDSYLDAFFKLSTADRTGRMCLQCQWLWNVLQYLQDYLSGELFLPDATVISFLSANQTKYLQTLALKPQETTALSLTLLSRTVCGTQQALTKYWQIIKSLHSYVWISLQYF